MQGKLEFEFSKSYPTMSMNISLTLLVPLLWHCYPSIVKINCSNVSSTLLRHTFIHRRIFVR